MGKKKAAEQGKEYGFPIGSGMTTKKAGLFLVFLFKESV